MTWSVAFRNTFSHAYEAERQSNGNYTIRAVPVLPAVDGAKGVALTSGWLKRAAARILHRKYSQGYLPRVHVEHLGDVAGVNRAAGFMDNPAVRPLMLDGRLVDTIFVDLVEVPPDVFEEIKSLRLPYRSAEVPSTGEEELKSLALMQTFPPYFKLPVTCVWEQPSTTGGRVQFKEDVCMGFETEEPDEQDQKTEYADGSPPDGGAAPPPAPPPPTAGAEVPPWAGEIKELLMKLLAAVGGQGGPPATGEPGPSVAARVPFKEAALGRLVARVDSLEARHAQSADEESLGRLVTRFKEEGVFFDEKRLRETITEFGVKGTKALESYIVSYMEGRPRISTGRGLPGKVKSRGHDEELIAFKDADEEVREAVRAASVDWEENEAQFRQVFPHGKKAFLEAAASGVRRAKQLKG